MLSITDFILFIFKNDKIAVLKNAKNTTVTKTPTYYTMDFIMALGCKTLKCFVLAKGKMGPTSQGRE
jgi:hypothetical protein